MASRSMSKEFVEELQELSSSDEVEKVARFFRDDPNASSDDNQILGVSIGKVFPIAKKYTDMPLSEIETLLESPYYEVRMGAVSIMDFQARQKKITDEQREALYELYLRRHDRIDNWDLVDRAAPHVLGGYLVDKPRDVLYELAESNNPWERRSAIVATYYFIRKDDLEDTFKIAEMLIQDEHELVQKAVGSWIREAGKRDQDRLTDFLEKHAQSMPRPMLRLAVQKLPEEKREKYLAK